MKKIITILLLFLIVNVYSQAIKLSSGVFYTSLDLPVGVYDTKINVMPFFVGVDYWEHSNFMLSSEIGFLPIGGEEIISTWTGDSTIPIQSFVSKEKFNYLHLNTTFRYRILLQNNFSIYAGLGPKIDILVDSDKFGSEPYSDLYKMPKTFIGAKTEIGAFYDFSKIRVGFNGTYFLNIDSKQNSIDYNHKAYGVLASLGYKL